MEASEKWEEKHLWYNPTRLDRLSEVQCPDPQHQHFLLLRRWLAQLLQRLPAQWYFIHTTLTISPTQLHVHISRQFSFYTI